MTTTIDAYYEGGVFHPKEPLKLPEGTAVRLTVEPVPDAELTEEQVIRRMKAAKSVKELFEAYDLGAKPDDFDLIAAMNETRRLEGRPPLSIESCREGDE